MQYISGVINNKSSNDLIAGTGVQRAPYVLVNTLMPVRDGDRVLARIKRVGLSYWTLEGSHITSTEAESGRPVETHQLTWCWSVTAIMDLSGEINIKWSDNVTGKK